MTEGERMDEMLAQYESRLVRYASAKRAAGKGADTALQRLIEVATGDTGQSLIVRHMLLSLYNGTAHPFPLTDLRGLDLELLNDALTVIRADALQFWGREVHEVADEAALFESWQRDAFAG